MSSDKIVLKDEEKNRLISAYPYLQKGDYNKAFEIISNCGRGVFCRNEPINILSFLDQHNIDLWNKVTIIPRGAFYKCLGLRNITIPKNVEFIGGCAFYGTTNLIINYEGTVDQWLQVHKDTQWNSGLSCDTVWCDDGRVGVAI